MRYSRIDLRSLSIFSTRRSKNIVVSESPRDLTTGFNGRYTSQTRKLVENLDVTAEMEFSPKTQTDNLIQAKEFVTAYNRERESLRTLKADLAYSLSLRIANLCGNCLCPIKTKTMPKNLLWISNGHQMPSGLLYADVKAYYDIRKKRDKQGKLTEKLEYYLKPAERIFNLKCGCGIN